MNAKANKKSKAPSSLIAQNKKAGHDYVLSERMEAGVVLEGWEVKSLRAGKVQMSDAFVIVRNGEAWLMSVLINPLISASTHVNPQAVRSRKLLLHKNQIDQLVGAVERKGFSIVATRMYWSRGRVKVEIALGKGKKLHDKRASDKDRDWKRQQERIMKNAG